MRISIVNLMPRFSPEWFQFILFLQYHAFVFSLKILSRTELRTKAIGGAGYEVPLKGHPGRLYLGAIRQPTQIPYPPSVNTSWIAAFSPLQADTNYLPGPLSPRPRAAAPEAWVGGFPGEQKWKSGSCSRAKMLTRHAR
ncbi:hypothetical protein CB1_002519007 [Camelus ferus]|nr:hypothetical protein CB1_002519007 [Camelus ferus]